MEILFVVHPFSNVLAREQNAKDTNRRKNTDSFTELVSYIPQTYKYLRNMRIESGCTKGYPPITQSGR